MRGQGRVGGRRELENLEEGRVEAGEKGRMSRLGGTLTLEVSMADLIRFLRNIEMCCIDRGQQQYIENSIFATVAGFGKKEKASLQL